MARPDAVLKNLPEEVLDELWDLKHPADPREQEPLGLVSICALLPERYGVKLGKSALSEFFQWLEAWRDQRARARHADRIKEEIAKDHTLTPEQIKKAGQRIFMMEGLLQKDAKVFAAAVEIGQNDTRLAQNEEMIRIRKEAGKREETKLSLATKGKLEAGLDALFAEIKGNAKAEAAFKQLQEVVRKA
jgi:hypothetical protein